MTDPHLKEFVAATGALNAARRHRYEALSVALAAGHPQHVVAAAARMSPPSLSRMIRQDTARPPDRRLLPGLRTGKVEGRTVRWFVAPLPLNEPGGSKALTVSARNDPKPLGTAVRNVNQHNPKV